VTPRPSLGVWGESFDELEAVARAADDAGFSAVWTSELHRTAVVPLAAMARATTRVQLGTAIMWAFTRSPMVTALAALDLDEASGGRMNLGLGTGVRRLNHDWHNRPFDRPVARLRETVDVIRAVIARAHTGGTIEVNGDLERIHLRGYERPFPPVRTSIPIYLASVGPQLTRLAGEIGDGWIAHELGSPAYFRERILPQLQAGLRAAGRTRDTLKVVVSACCVTRPDAREAKRQAAGLVAFYATVKTYDDFFDFHGFLPEAKRVQELFRAGEHDRLGDAVPDEMVDALAFAGTPDDVRARLAAYDGLADMVKLSPPTHFVAAEVTRTAQRGIIELLAT
jgi:probable F420-dependent oxidoreductase